MGHLLVEHLNAVIFAVHEDEIGAFAMELVVEVRIVHVGYRHSSLPTPGGRPMAASS
jgi:hypothetical protein